MRTALRKALVVVATLALQVGCSANQNGPTSTIAEHLAKGMDALHAALSTHATDKALEAANHFSAAAALLDVDTGASDADRNRARFYGAVARVALLAQPYSDFKDDGLQDLGDLLDGFGLGGTTAQRSNLDTFDVETCVTVTPYPQWPAYTFQECRLKDLSPTSPRSGEIQTFLFDQVRPALLGAVRLLDGVDAGFADRIEHDGESVELDRTDALFVKGIAAAMAAKIDLQQAYDLDVDIDAAVASEGYELPDILADYPLFLTLKQASATALPEARADALTAVTAFQAALASLEAEQDDQADDLIAFSDYRCASRPPPEYWGCTIVYNPAEKVAELEDVLAKIEAALRAQGNHTIALGTVEEPFDIVVNPDRLFAGINIRAAIPTIYNAGAFGDRPGPFVDPTLGGVLVSGLDLNEDLDGDGAPDLFGGYTYFPPQYFVGATFYTYGWPFQLGQNRWLYGPLSVRFDATGAGFLLSLPVQTCDYSITWTCVTAVEEYSGTYGVVANVLTLTFDTPGPSGVKTASYTAQGFGDRSFNATAAYYDVNGAPLVPDYGSWTSWWY